MGLDVSNNLIVGIPLLSLGIIQEKSEVKQLVDPLGNPKERVSLEYRYLVAHNGSRYLIGSNEYNISTGWSDRIKWSYDKLFSADESKWCHYSDTGEPGEVIVGLIPESIMSSAIGRYQYFDITQLDIIVDMIPIVREYLKDKFGWDGTPFVISMTSYSY